MSEVLAWETDERLQRITDLLGGAKVFPRPVVSPVEAHRILLEGLPWYAVVFLVKELEYVDRDAAFERAIGFSGRTLQRRKAQQSRPLNPDQSSRAWKFAEVLTMAAEILGSRRQAEEWMQASQIGLDGMRPIDLLATAAGTEMVDTYLQRLEYGVYT